MRKFQHVALVAAAAGGLSAIGVVPSFADAPAAYNAAPPPAPQQGVQAASWTGSQATAHTYGSPAQQQALPQRGADVSPQVNPQVSPKLSPQLTPQPAAAQSGAVEQNNLFRPYQECSPQNLLNANLPVAVLAAAETKGVNCGQSNSQANALAKAH
ncbi:MULTISPECIES: hypothetical protein [unclassified Streptomyces]|uniref:hypothetical protein n=1 Tax=unclassified Streptomyces TaxID=2593676 RepID=UPI00224DB778|nr:MULTISPECIES: hypothetical protein [unclassified Streptomyces]MCX5049112.1 hypothetical protein [Streptomyces sp. NBC_00474]MCX5056141.1 hypothetical protein [Streptomyces sp. NBC_00452]MCX5246952.1 hypothetical protein [Streptomyces sp. NBC_00201]MCX5287246.1 hypothetical protein [Streptomyces sp. NBC_00183]